MTQSLHILRKDIRHLWLDLSMYAALLIAAAIAIPKSWDPANLSNSPLRILITLLNFLIPIIWLLLVARVVHGESLVGDTQFWITRPYAWTSLLGAKLLFLVLCLILPFAIMQWTMVLQAGTNPMHALPAQMTGLLKTAIIVWLTFTAVASVTSTIQRMFMSMVAVVLFWAGALTLVSGAPGPRMALPFASEAFGIYLGVLVLATLIFQFATRNTLASRVALIAIAVVFVELFGCLVEGQLQAPVNAFVHHHYPLSKDALLRLAFDPTTIPSQDTGQGQHSISALVIARLPVTMQGLDSTTQLNDQNISFTIDAPGYHYTAPWRPADLEDNTLRIFIPQKAFDAAHGASVHMHLSEIAQRMSPGTPQTILAADSFRVPENGVCHLLPTLSGDNVSCRYAYEIKSRTMIRAAVGSGTCIKPEVFHAALETLAARPPSNGPDPTIEIPLHLGGTVCPGTPITFTPYYPAENFRLELDIPALSLDRYLVR
jgi:hypothetical protein